MRWCCVHIFYVRSPGSYANPRIRSLDWTAPQAFYSLLASKIMNSSCSFELASIQPGTRRIQKTLKQYLDCRGRRRAARYTLPRLMEALLLARLLNDATKLPEVLVRSMSFLVGPAEAENLGTSCPKNNR